MPSKRKLHESIARNTTPQRQDEVITCMPYRGTDKRSIVRSFEKVKPGVLIYALIDSTTIVFGGYRTRRIPVKRQILVKVLSLTTPDTFECEVVVSASSQIGEKIIINKSQMVI